MTVAILFSLEFFVYAVWRFDPIGYIYDRYALWDHFSDDRFCFSDEVLLLFSHTLELTRDRYVRIWMQNTETLCFKHFLHAKYTESIRDRRIDIECLEGDTFTFFRVWMMIESLHVVQAIREFHDDDTEVIDHRDEHLPEALDRAFLTTILDRRELRESLTDRCYLLTKSRCDLPTVKRCILDHIVKEA